MSNPDQRNPTDQPRELAGLTHVYEMAERLPHTAAADYVRRSVLELAQARASGAAVRPAIDRLVASIRHLQQQAEGGRRRDQQHGALAIERLLNVLQEEVLPDLRRNGCLPDEP